MYFGLEVTYVPSTYNSLAKSSHTGPPNHKTPIRKHKPDMGRQMVLMTPIVWDPNGVIVDRIFFSQGKFDIFFLYLKKKEKEPVDWNGGKTVNIKHM